MSDNDAIFFGLCTGILGILAGPAGIIAGGIAIASGWNIGKNIARNRRKEENSSSSSGLNLDLVHYLPDYNKEYNNTLLNNSYSLPNIDIQEFIRENANLLPNNHRFDRTQHFVNRSEYHIPMPRFNYEPPTPPGIYPQERYRPPNRARQSPRRFRINEYGEVFEE